MLRLICCFCLMFSISCLKGSYSQPFNTEDEIPTEPRIELPLAPTEEDAPLMFVREFNQLKPLPLDIRGLKLEQWLDNSKLAEIAQNQLNSERASLGGQSFSEGRPESSLWSATAIEKWVTAIAPYCLDTSISDRYAASNGISSLFQDIYGRVPAPEELQDMMLMNDELALSEAEKFTVQCMALLGSLEFAAP